MRTVFYSGAIMNAVDVIGYAYDAEIHCVECSQLAADTGVLRREPPLRLGTDENGLAFDLVDREGNSVSPVFGDSESIDICGDCGREVP